MGILPMRNSAGITAWKAVPLHFFNGLLTPDKNLIAVGAESDERGKDDSRQIASDTGRSPRFNAERIGWLKSRFTSHRSAVSGRSTSFRPAAGVCSKTCANISPPTTTT